MVSHHRLQAAHSSHSGSSFLAEMKRMVSSLEGGAVVLLFDVGGGSGTDTRSCSIAFVDVLTELSGRNAEAGVLHAERGAATAGYGRVVDHEAPAQEAGVVVERHAVQKAEALRIDEHRCVVGPLNVIGRGVGPTCIRSPTFRRSPSRRHARRVCPGHGSRALQSVAAASVI